jgi:hypothetical protein
METAFMISVPTLVLGMECGQAVKELGCGVAGALHEVGVHLVGTEQCHALLPDFAWFAHRHPHVGVDEVNAGDAGGDVVGDHDVSAGAVGKLAGGGDHVVGWPQLAWPHTSRRRRLPGRSRRRCPAMELDIGPPTTRFGRTPADGRSWSLSGECAIDSSLPTIDAMRPP